MTSGNSRLQRFGSWLAWRLGGYGSPSLHVMGLRPTLQWVLSGLSMHAASRTRRSFSWRLRLQLARLVAPSEVRATIVNVDEWPPMFCRTCRNVLPGVTVGGGPIEPGHDEL